MDTPDRLLCPVRALKFYLNVTGGCRPNSTLFVKVRGEGPVSSQTISAWLVKCIQFCYDSPVSAKAHEVRRTAASWAYKSNKHNIDDILRAGSWASHNTFSSFYLADVRQQPDNKFRFCRVVAGRQVDNV